MNLIDLTDGAKSRSIRRFSYRSWRSFCLEPVPFERLDAWVSLKFREGST